MNLIAKRQKKSPVNNDDVVIVFGINPVREVLRAKQRAVYTMFITQPAPKAWGELKGLVPRHVTVTQAPREQLTSKFGTTDHQGIVALVGKLPIRSRCFDVKYHPVVVLLDSIQDPRNLGAIIRSASCTSVSGIIVPQKNSAPLDGVTAKSSAGLIEYMPIYQPVSSAVAIEELKAAGYSIYLATAHGVDVRTAQFKEPLCIVIGSEGSGISTALLKKGQQIAIPQRVSDISYNASVAAGILFFYVNSSLKKI